jgi:hypothetical protein
MTPPVRLRISFSNAYRQRLIRFILFEIESLLAGEQSDASDLERMTATLDAWRRGT